MEKTTNATPRNTTMSRRDGRSLLALLALATAASLLAGCQWRGDVRPLSSEGVPPPRIVDVPRPCQAGETPRNTGPAEVRCE